MQKTIVALGGGGVLSASEMAIKIIYLRNILGNMRLAQIDNIAVYEDNTARIAWSIHIIWGRERAKHIDTRKHFTHEAVQNGHMRLYKTLTEYQLADILPKGLQLAQFERSLYSLLGENPLPVVKKD